MSYAGKLNILSSNPYGNTLYCQESSNAGEPPPTPPVTRMVTEDGQFMVTQDSQFMVTEG